jgi:hypothetical protein
VELYLHSLNTPSWRGAQLKHRDNFTFTFYMILQGFRLLCHIKYRYTEWQRMGLRRWISFITTERLKNTFQSLRSRAQVISGVSQHRTKMRVLLHRVKAFGENAHQISLSSAKVKNAWSYVSTLAVFHGMVVS